MLIPRNISAQELYVRIGQLIAQAPDLRQPKSDHDVWISKVVATVELLGDIRDNIAVRDAAEHYREYPDIYHDAFGPILQRALARAELAAPAGSSGTFIAAASPMDAMAAIGKVLKAPATTLLIVDPYMDETILTDYAAMIPERVAIHLLTDAATEKPSLKPAVHRWATQYGSTRPVEARRTAERALHDRLIIADSSKVWTVTQSFKDFAARSPAEIIAAGHEIASLKISAYEALWVEATPI